VEEVDCQRAIFKVIAEDVGIVALFSGGDALLFRKLMDSGELVAKTGGGFKLFLFGSGGHARSECALQLGMTAFKEELRVAHCLLVEIGRGEFFNAGAQTAMNVVLQAGAGMVAGEVDLATGMRKLRWMSSTTR